MIPHEALGSTPFARLRRLRQLIAEGRITLAGNRKLKIFGTLDCASGKRMKAKNRVFFVSAEEAANNGYRPCGHCCRDDYRSWKGAVERLRQR